MTVALERGSQTISWMGPCTRAAGKMEKKLESLQKRNGAMDTERAEQQEGRLREREAARAAVDATGKEDKPGDKPKPHGSRRRKGSRRARRRRPESKPDVESDSGLVVTADKVDEVGASARMEHSGELGSGLQQFFDQSSVASLSLGADGPASALPGVTTEGLEVKAEEEGKGVEVDMPGDGGVEWRTDGRWERRD